MYFRKLKLNGIVAMHVSNLNLELASVAAGVAQANGALAQSAFRPLRSAAADQPVWTDDCSNIVGAILRNVRERRIRPVN